MAKSDKDEAAAGAPAGDDTEPERTGGDPAEDDAEAGDADAAGDGDGGGENADDGDDAGDTAGEGGGGAEGAEGGGAGGQDTTALPEDGETADRAPDEASAGTARAPEPRDRPHPAPRFEPPHRTRHPEPALQPAGSSTRFWAVVALAVVVLYLALSFAHSRSYRIADEDGQATVQKGYFLPGGYAGVIPQGAADAFAPIPYITPPQGAVTTGSLQTVAATFYALLYLTAGEAQDDAVLFDTYDQQAASLEAWYHERYGVYPEAMDEMSDLRARVRDRRAAAREYRDRRAAVLDQIEELVGMLPDRAPANLEEDAALFQRFLEEARARQVGPARRNVPSPPAPAGQEEASEQPAAVQPAGETAPE